MIALPLHQPWASLIVAGVKRHETRGRQITHRGPIAIHAGRTIVPPEQLTPECRALCQVYLCPSWWSNRAIPTGAIVCIADLVACHPTETRAAETTPNDRIAGNWAAGRWAYELGHVRALAMPIPARGLQGPWPWDAPDDLAARLLPEGVKP